MDLHLNLFCFETIEVKNVAEHSDDAKQDSCAVTQQQKQQQQQQQAECQFLEDMLKQTKIHAYNICKDINFMLVEEYSSLNLRLTPNFLFCIFTSISASSLGWKWCLFTT